MKKVLVVDDDDGITQMLEKLLEFKGFEVTLCTAAEHIQELLADNVIDIILLDMLIGGEDGAKVCSGLKNSEATAGIPVVMISALPDAGEKCLRAGAEAFVSKPFETQELVDTLNANIPGQSNSSE